MPWSPFTKPLDQLGESDLDELAGQSEASWLEYKADTTNPNLVKAVASFANGHGGWVFLGISANDANNPVLPPVGVPPSDWQVERIRQAISRGLSPVPDVHIRLVALASGRVVFVLSVEEGLEPPYIRSQDGRVYVRQGEVSEPIDHVRDRRELDRLYDRAERLASRWERVLQQRGHMSIVQDFHRSALARRRGGDAPTDQAHLVFLLVPWGACDSHLGSQWTTEPTEAWRIFAGAAGWGNKAGVERLDWQHGELIGPARFADEGDNYTVAATIGTDGLLGLSLIAPWRDLRYFAETLHRPICGWLANAFRAYTEREYHGRLRLLVRACGNGTQTATEREWSLAALPVAGRGSHPEPQAVDEKWLYDHAVDVLTELQRWASAHDHITGA